jgi:hypothetical protein
MSHSIQTSGVASDTYDSSDDGVPVVGPMWQNPVLTIADTPDYKGRQRQVTMLFHGGHHPEDAMVVLNPWHADSAEAPVRIVGEDLFALRELLAEMPAEAFHRPADPVEVPVDHGYLEGDVITCHPIKSVYRRQADGEWIRTGRNGDIEGGYSDEWVAHILKGDPRGESYRGVILHGRVV